MANENLEAYTLSVVVIGAFNPSIVHPFWLANKKLIREQEAESANIEVVHTEISKFSIDWATFEITRDRFVVKTSQEPYFEPVRDLILEIFKLLKETPIRSFGTNHSKYYDLRDADRHYKFGNKLAPLSNWSDYLEDPRLQTLEIIETKRKDGKKGLFRIKIQPPDIKLSAIYGILINVNDHLDINERDFVKTFSENWKPSFDRASEITELIWEKANN